MKFLYNNSLKMPKYNSCSSDLKTAETLTVRIVCFYKLAKIMFYNIQDSKDLAVLFKSQRYMYDVVQLNQGCAATLQHSF